MKINETVIQIARKYTFHKQSCSLNVAYADEGDFCDCNIRERRTNLAIEIQTLLDNKNAS